ncbi:adenosylcobinamide-GDP ribazoletransferase [Desertimonas flava]|uniref:adenosylcobinamide-GDP ribazoletransferase n=1 Tax=Desertimonas flava TaxID=2064846 RepID=UPI000E34379D|nr:adenosylcobinamide-GDP ribazoletransferase [Desertimonas flava]
MSLPGAVQFLTRVPIRLPRAATARAIVPWFPVVGAAVGAVVGLVAIGLDRVLAPFPAAAVGVLAGVTITGAFHEDGFADSADAIAGGATRERRLEILRDSRLGTYGTAAVCGSIVLRVAAVTSLLDAGWKTTIAACVAAHAIARVAGVVLMVTVAPAEPDGLGAAFAREVSARRAGATTAVAVAIGAAATGWWVGPFAVATAAAILLVAVLARRSFGGVNGDLLGAAEQVAEIAVLLTASGLAVHQVWWA